MPPKTVVCSICGETVLKAHTLALKGGSRACRSHSGVQEESLEIQQEQKQETKKSMSRKRKLYQPYPMPSHEELNRWRDKVKTTCWVCEAEGINAQDYYFKCLVALKRLELRGDSFNLLNMPEKVRELVTDIPLFSIPYDSNNDDRLFSRVRDRKLRNILHFLRYIQLCPDCIQRLNLNDRFKALFPELSYDELEAAIRFTDAIDPILKSLAVKAENQN